MSEKQLFLSHTPLQLLEQDQQTWLSSPGLGAVIARPGMGKTAFLVQLSLYALLKEHSVVHIGLEDTVPNVCLWYDEIRRNISSAHGQQLDDAAWEAMVKRRFIIAQKHDSFNVPRLEQQLRNLVEQAIFKPEILIIDGLALTADAASTLAALKALGRQFNLRCWLSFCSELQEPLWTVSIPENLRAIMALLDYSFLLMPGERAIRVGMIQSAGAEGGWRHFVLDPTNLLLRKAEEQ